MATKTQTQGQFILTYLETKTGKTQFSIDEIYKTIHSQEHKDFREQLDELSPNSYYTYWTREYLASLFHNYATRPKNPKIQRIHNKVYYYSLIKK